MKLISKSIKGTLGISIILLLGFVVIACTHTPAPETEITTPPETLAPQPTVSFSMYNGDGFAIPYPDSWEVIPLGPSDSNRSSLVLFQNLQQGIVSAYFLVTKEYLLQKADVGDYFKFQEMQLPDNYIDYTPIETNSIILNGREAVEHIWSFTNKSSTTDFSVSEFHLLLCVIDGEVAWSLEADSFFFDNYRSTFDTMVSGFSILDE